MTKILTMTVVGAMALLTAFTNSPPSALGSQADAVGGGQGGGGGGSMITHKIGPSAPGSSGSEANPKQRGEQF